MISKETVRNIIVPVIERLSVFLVDIRVDASNKITVEADTPDGITIEECIVISQAIEKSLDRETEDFELEVSSPGLTEAFKVMEQYQKNCGRTVDVVKKNGQKLTGILQQVDEQGIVLETKTKVKNQGDKRAKLVAQTVVLDFNDIKATKVTITF